VNEQSPHLDVAGYAMGSLSPDERAAFAEHLAQCESCRRELQDLMPAVGLLGLVDPELPEPPPGLEARTLLAVERAATGTRTRWPPRLSFAPRRRWLVPALAAACLGLAVTVGLVLSGDDGGGGEPVEAVAELRRGDRIASVSLVKTGIGRVVELRTDELPILPKGEYYELWFVGAGDRPGDPNRISAGTFHPDENGRSSVTFAAAVDPREYRRMAVTAEPGDGDPSPAGRDVLSGKIELR
jgi:hypothetical protein